MARIRVEEMTQSAPPSLMSSPEGPEPGRERDVEVTRRQPRPDHTFIPPEIVDYFSARGQQVSLASGLSQSISQLALWQRFPVSLLEIDEDRRDEFKRVLRRHGYTFRDDYAWKGDAILYAQPHEARDAQLSEGMERWFRTERHTEKNTMDELNDQLARDPMAAQFGHVEKAKVKRTFM